MLDKEKNMSVIALHHILVKSSALAEEILQELKLGADFNQLAREYSTCPSASNDGFAGFHNVDELDEELVKAINNAEGDYALEPIKTQFGFHLVKPVSERRSSLIIDD